MVRVTNGSRAYCKPTKIDRFRFRPAREKIAADLGADLQLPIPPVLLHIRQDVEPARCQQYVCLSKILYSTQMQIGAYRTREPSLTSNLADEVRAALEPAVGIIAYDCWLANQDRGNPRNTLICQHEGDSNCYPLFLDFSFSLGYPDGEWLDNEWQAFSEYPTLPELRSMIGDGEGLMAVAERIASLDSDRIDDVVDRIADAEVGFLGREAAEAIKRGLNWRKNQLVTFVEKHYLS